MTETAMHAAAEAPGTPRARVEKDVMSRKEAADYVTRKFFRLATQTLANMASNNNKGRGPAFTRVGWCQVQYRRADLEAWARKRMVSVE